MNSIVRNLFVLILFPFLILRRIFYWQITNRENLPGKDFGLFGFVLGRKLLFELKFTPKLLLNPVSIVRYFEYDFVDSSFEFKDELKVLDISSPYLFGLFQVNKFKLDYHYINPDKRDLINIKSIITKLIFNGIYTSQIMDARNLQFADNFFDAVISISVIEHIAGEGDSIAMKEIWRTLKPGGILSFTVPVKKQFEIDYRNRDEYSLNTKIEQSDNYFFQRFYDDQKIQERLLSSICNYEIIHKKIFGVNGKEFFSEYKQRWLKYGYWETVKDPYYIVNEFSFFNKIEDLPDIGVIGLTIKKII